MKIEESIVVPAYNEEKIISKTIDTLHSFLSKYYKNFEIIIADDGSRDSTFKIAQSIEKKYKNVSIVRNEKNMGRGSVLTKAFSSAKGDFVAYVDADLAIDVGLLPKLIECVKNNYDIATGSKHLKNSNVEYGKLRRLLSSFYSLLSRLILNCPIRDYQCGMKALKKSSFEKLLPYIREKGWAWDTEVIALAHYNKMMIAELPAVVVNIPYRKSRVAVLRDVYKMFMALLRIRKHKNIISNNKL